MQALNGAQEQADNNATSMVSPSTVLTSLEAIANFCSDPWLEKVCLHGWYMLIEGQAAASLTDCRQNRTCPAL